MKYGFGIAAVLLAVGLSLSGVANAATISFEDKVDFHVGDPLRSSNGNITSGLFIPRGSSRDVTFSGVPTPATDAVLTVTGAGDINNVIEFAEVYMESLSGTFIGNVFDLPMDGPNFGCAERTDLCTDTINIDLGTLLPFVADSILTFTFFIPSDNGAASVRIDEVSLAYGVLAPVPVPAALPLFATALAGLGFMSWRRKRRDAMAA